MTNFKKYLPVLILPFSYIISCHPIAAIKKDKQELELTANLGGTVYLDTTSTIYISTTLFNPTTDTLDFVTMTCSYEDMFLTDTSIFKIQSKFDCFSNYPVVMSIPPGSRLDQFIMVRPTSKNTELLDHKIRIGMYLLVPKKENELTKGIIEQYENRRNAKVLWSNELNLNRLYRRFYN